MAITDKIHPVYSLWFLTIDPILTVIGMWGNLFDHDLATQAFLDNYPPTEHLKCFLYQIGGMGTSYLILQLTLLRYTHDINIWKMVQLAILPADFTLLTATYVDWASIVVTGICTVLRIAFVLGIGVKDAKGRAKRA
ncbi:hypothetical protein ACHAPU_002968 [Fusarium lateritium]